MSKDGLLHLKNYLSCEDQEVYEPYFIAQYLLAPINTSVKCSFHPWMMNEYEIPTTKQEEKKPLVGHQLGKLMKSKIYLKYNLLVNLLQVVKQYGRTAKFNFENSEKLKKIKHGQFGDNNNTNKVKSTVSIDSFMTIWLLTLPEKFKEWYESNNSLSTIVMEETSVMFLLDQPTFPEFAPNKTHTKLDKNPETKSYDFLPKSWNLEKCF